MSISSKLMSVLGLTCLIALLCILSPLLTAKGSQREKVQLVKYDALQAEIALTAELQLQIANVWQFITDASLTKDKEVIEREAKPAYEKSQQIISQLLDLNKD